MKANELRIGNWINFGSKLNNLPINGTLIADFEEKPHEFEYLYPIPLTEEWLLKFGFTIHTEGLDYCKESDNYNFVLCKVIGGYENDVCLNIIEYVHQLQNLYFALTGEELTIKL